MIGHRGEVKGMGVVVRVFLLSYLFWLTHSWFNSWFLTSSWVRLWPARTGELLSSLFPARGLRRRRACLGFDSGRPGPGSSFLLCFLREGYADAEGCRKVGFGFGFCISKRGIVLFVHVPRRLPSVPSNRSCDGYSFVKNMYLFICKSHIT